MKNVAIVSLAGIEGTLGDITAYYAYSVPTGTELQMTVLEAKGTSTRQVRSKAELLIEQSLDLSMLSTLLISTDTAKDRLSKYLDTYYRNPINPKSTKIAIVEGDLKEFIDVSVKSKNEAGEHYEKLIENYEKNSLIPIETLQTVGDLLMNDNQDLALPYLTMDKEQERPELAGLALFSGEVFTGEIVEPRQSLVLVLMKDEKDNSAEVTYMKEETPITINIINVKRSIHVQEPNQVTLDYKIRVGIDEFPEKNLNDTKKKKEIQSFLNDELSKDMDKVIEQLQKANSDVLGLGRIIHAYHQSMYDKDWHSKFKELQIETNVTTEITVTGITQ